MKHRSHLWLMAALAGGGMLAAVLLPFGPLLPFAVGLPLLACLAMLVAMLFLMRGMNGQPSPAADGDQAAQHREPAGTENAERPDRTAPDDVPVASAERRR